MDDTRIVSANGLPVIGVYTISNTGSLVVHAIEDERVQVSLNGGEPEWCDTYSQIAVDDQGEYEMEDGFLWGEMKVPFSDVMRL